jgi:hypothetical protein
MLVGNSNPDTTNSAFNFGSLKTIDPSESFSEEGWPLTFETNIPSKLMMITFDISMDKIKQMISLFLIILIKK